MSTVITVVSVAPTALVLVPTGFGLQGVPGPAGATGLQGVPGPAAGDGLAAVAGEALGGHRCVVTDAAGMAWYASNTNPTHLGRFAGITLGAASAGAAVSIARVGVVTEPSWAWTPDAPAYLSTNGLLTQTPPTVGFQQVIGMALSPITLFINPREPLVIL